MFSKAVKRKQKLRLALVGPAGSGKTWSALELASGIGGTIALIDTEHGSASLYSDRFEFEVCELAPPFTPESYIRAIKAASNFDILIVDSLSHAWAGEGGLLEQVDQRKASGGNQFTAWGSATQSQNKMVNALLACPCHLIATFRAKMEYVLETNSKGKQVPKKVGLAPVQREGVEYEFTSVLDVGMDHKASVGASGKDRTGLFVDKAAKQLTAADGKKLAEWLNSGEAVPEPPPPAPPPQPAPSTNSNGHGHGHGHVDATRKTALDLLGLEIRGAKQIEMCLTDQSYGTMLQKFGVQKTNDLNLQQIEQVTEQIRLLRAAARVLPPERQREPGDDDQDDVTAAMGEFFCGDGPYDDGK